MKYSEVKKVKAFCEELFSTPDYREVISYIESNDDDFEVDGVRFIKASEIDRIQCEHLESDEYMLGCFNAWFISDVLEIDCSVIEAMQKAEAYEALGKLIISMDKIEELQQAYACSDGYGHYFNSYDFGEEEESFNGVNYYIFDNH